MNMERVVAYDTVEVPTTALKSNPIEFSVADTKLSMYIKYVKGTEDGVVISVEWSDEVMDTWGTIGDFGGATSPGMNAILPFEGVLTADGTYLVPIPQRHLVQGDYRMSIVRDGAVACSGTVYAVMKSGEY